jgi:hypothetical protein
MKKIIYTIVLFSIFLGCENKDKIEIKLSDGTYVGTFQREIVWSKSDTANISITISSNNWSGTSDKIKYPALCNGTFLIEGDTITFNNECAWTAEFDWSLILSGKYVISKKGDTFEFYRDYRSSTSDTYVDRYKIKKVNAR